MELTNTAKIFTSITLVIFSIIIFATLFAGELPSKFNSPDINTSNVDGSVAVTTLLSMLFVGVVVSLSVILIPQLADFKLIMGQMLNSVFVVLYVIVLFVSLCLIPKKYLDSYGYIITPATMAAAGALFYKSLSQNFIHGNNIVFERIKLIVLFFCMITLFVIYYTIDPGGIISTFFGPAALITLLLSAFSFLYMIVILTIPGKFGGSSSGKPEPATISKESPMSKISKYSMFSGFALVMFIIALTVSILQYDDFISTPNVSIVVISLSLLVGILWTSTLSYSILPEFKDNLTTLTSKLEFIQKIFMVVMGLVISGLAITWLVMQNQAFLSQDGVVSFALNAMLIVCVLSFIYNIFRTRLSPANNSKKTAIFRLIGNLVMYIPCMFSDLATSFGSAATGAKMSSDADAFLMLGATVIFGAAVLLVPSLNRKFEIQGGLLLLDRPVALNEETALMSYNDMNEFSENDQSTSRQYNYRYGVSFWVYIGAVAPNTNIAYTQYTNVLNLGDKPQVLYNGVKNTMIVTMPKNLVKSVDVAKYPTHGSDQLIIYAQKNVVLQKWNNFVINYDAGTLDIFINGDLVRSVPNIVPFMTTDAGIVGAPDGVNGGVCNINYFKNPLTATQMYYLYNMVKSKTPPTLSDQIVNI